MTDVCDVDGFFVSRSALTSGVGNCACALPQGHTLTVSLAVRGQLRPSRPRLLPLQLAVDAAAEKALRLASLFRKAICRWEGEEE